ncbi:hypothetical protein EIQ04_08710, partial [Xanthomonas campestris pv. raphani]
MSAGCCGWRGAGGRGGAGWCNASGRPAHSAGLPRWCDGDAGLEQLSKRLRSRQAGAAGARNPHVP